MTRYKIANYILFQIGWLACVWGAAESFPWLGLVVFLPTVLLHLSWSPAPMRELKLLAVCGVTGITFDAVLLATGWVAYPNGEWIIGLAPYWMMILWLFLGTTLNLSMAWMKCRPVAAFALGAVGGPLAYLAGQRLGGIEILNTLPALTALAIGWGLVMPLLAKAATRLNGFEPLRLPDFIVEEEPANGVTQHG